MLDSFTRKISRRHIALTLAFAVLAGPALIFAPAAGAQRKNAKPTPKKAATPAKKTAAKATAESKKKNDSKSKKETAKDTRSNRKDDRSAKKNDRSSKRDDRSSRTAKADRKSNEKSTKDRRANTKQALAEKNKKASARNEKNDRRDSRRDDRGRKETTAKNNRSTRERSTPRVTAKPATAKNTTRQTAKPAREEKTPPETTLVKTAAPETELPQIIVTTNSVPVRSQAKVDAAPVSSVRLGTVLKVTERNPAWYKVQFVKDGKSSAGWISANAVGDLNAAQKEEIYRQIVERNYRPEMDFDSSVELYDFLKSTSGELNVSDAAADLELKRLFALRSALKRVPVGQTESAPYRQFLTAQEKEIVYDEPAGEWLVAANEFWNLHKKYQKLPASDAIAWEAANNPLPGECEGYVNCYLFDMRMRYAEYLNLHPAGRHSAEALKNITDYLAPIVADAAEKKVYNGPTDVTDRAEFNNLIAELRTIISRLNYTEKEKTLQQLRQIAEAYR